LSRLYRRKKVQRADVSVFCFDGADFPDKDSVVAAVDCIYMAAASVDTSS